MKKKILLSFLTLAGAALLLGQYLVPANQTQVDYFSWANGAWTDTHIITVNPPVSVAMQAQLTATLPTIPGSATNITAQWNGTFNGTCFGPGTVSGNYLLNGTTVTFAANIATPAPGAVTTPIPTYSN